MIKLQSISKSFDGISVLENISAEIPDSGIFAICGASGSGKTTTNETTSMQKMTNVKVHIKLEPVLLPDGMRGLLQATENTIKVVDKQN